ncbi:MAG: hypothetical protein GTO18_00200 [Anaerolineales bacterium]|nr:hypothetical protein [Anaerolineales bacterium]
MGRRPLLIFGGAVAVIIVGAVAWYLGSPLFIDRTVEEEFPIALATEMMETAVAMPDKEMDDEMPSGEQPVVLRSGEFVGADSFHLGSGTAMIFELSNSDRLLRLEDFMVTNGPDLHVLLATGSKPTGREDLGEYVDLGELKGNVGNQNYEIPDNLDHNAYRSVVIYCVPFHVVFATAELTE